MFGGKELQDEIVGSNSFEVYDFGARNYDQALGRWMNLDPLADKFFDYTPYNFVKNNPLIYIDPDGKDIIIWYTNSDGKKSSYTLNEKNLINGLQTAIQSKSDFFIFAVASIINNVGSLKKSDSNATKEALNDSEHNVSVKELKTGLVSYNGFNSVYWNPFSGVETEKDNSVISPATVLEHEIGHAYERAKGDVDGIKDRENTPMGRYTNAFEHGIITGGERTTAIAKGEIPRYGHDGIAVITTGPTSINIDAEKTFQLYKKLIKVTPYREWHFRYKKYIDKY
jgi:RHS repeat-associated protein